MKNYLYPLILLVLLVMSSKAVFSNNTKLTDYKNILNKNNNAFENTSGNRDSLSSFLPKGYIIVDTIYGDLNNDGLNDCVLIIKGTNKDKIITNEFGEKMDRNRRGIIILFNKNRHYIVAAKNYNCLPSKDEYSGVYMPPELWVYVKKENLYIHFGDGRYGYWEYTFRFQNSAFELIKFFRSDDSGPVVNRETSINFLTKKEIEKVNENENAEGGDEIFDKKSKIIQVKRLIKLSEIKDFNNLVLVSDFLEKTSK